MFRWYLTLFVMASCSVLAASQLTSSQELTGQQKARILDRFPQADKDGDGELSPAETKEVFQRILQRYPQADKDGDGELSEAERQNLFQMARKGRNRSRPDNADNRKVDKKSSDPAELLETLGLKSERDIEYRQNTAQEKNRLDFIYPKTKVYDKAPLFIYIHGGGNTGGTKNALYSKGHLILQELTESGVAVATIDYRLFDQGEELGFQHLFQDCKDALRFLALNADRFGIDPHKFITWGTSAGGSKALVTALTESDFLPGEVSGPKTEHTVIGAISFYGATTYLVEELWAKRLERFPTRSETKAKMIMKPNSGLSVDEIKKMVSADQHLSPASPPILLVHGEADPVVPIELSEHLYEAAKKHNIDVELVEVENAGHGFAPVKGKRSQPSMTWDESQRLVVERVTQWIKESP